MSLGNPWGLLALLAALPLVAAYFLRKRQPPVTVSALFLWRRPLTRAEEGPTLTRFRREASLALELLAVAAVALFLADVRTGDAAGARALVAVVDASLSTGARGPDGVSVHARLADALEARAREEGAGALTLVLAGPVGGAPRVLAGPGAPRARALEAYRALAPAGPAEDVGAALALARELAGPGAGVHVFTDAPPPAPPPAGVRWTALGRAQGNVAFVAAHRRDEGGAAALTLRVARWGPAPERVQVRLRAAPGPGAAAGVERTEEVALPEAGGAATLRVRLQGAGDVEALLPADALEADGRVVLPPAPARPLPVGLAEGLGEAEAAALRRFLAVAPGVAAADAGAEPLLFGPRGSGARVTLGAPGAPRTFLGPFFSERGSALLEDVQLADVRWTAGDAPPGRALVTAGPAVLVSQEADGRVHLNVDLARSNLQRTAAWPVLLGNLLEAARADREGFARPALALGEPLPVTTRAGARYTLAGPGGRRTLVGAGPLALPPPGLPGRYVLERDGDAVDAAVVLPLDARESDLTGRGSAEAGSAPSAPGGAPPREAWPLWVLLAALAADFWLTRRAG